MGWAWLYCARRMLVNIEVERCCTIRIPNIMMQVFVSEAP